MKIVRPFADRGNFIELLVPEPGDFARSRDSLTLNPLDLAIRYIQAKYGSYVERELAAAVSARIELEGDNCECGVFSECIPGEQCFRGQSLADIACSDCGFTDCGGDCV